MANMFRSRTGPLLVAAGIFGGLLYSTAGGKNQPRTRADPSGGVTGGVPVSETLQSIGGQGGPHARKEGENFPGSGMDISRNTKYQSHREDEVHPHAKRSPGRVTDESVGEATSYGSRKNV